MRTLIPGLIGIGLLVTFLTIMLLRVPAIPLIVIGVSVVLLLVWDFLNELRGNGN